MKSYGNNCVQYEVTKFRVFLHFRTKVFCEGYLRSRKLPTITTFMYALQIMLQLQAVSCSNCHDVIHYNALGYALRPWNMTKNYNATSYTEHKMLLKGLLVYQGILSHGESCYITKSRCTQPFFTLTTDVTSPLINLKKAGMDGRKLHAVVTFLCCGHLRTCDLRYNKGESILKEKLFKP